MSEVRPDYDIDLDVTATIHWMCRPQDMVEQVKRNLQQTKLDIVVERLRREFRAKLNEEIEKQRSQR